MSLPVNIIHLSYRAASIEVGEEEHAREKHRKSEGKGRSTKAELKAVNDDSYPFSHDVLGEQGRAFAHLGGVFTSILQIVDRGVKWELACQEWLAHKRMYNASLESDTDSDSDGSESEKPVAVPEKETPAVSPAMTGMEAPASDISRGAVKVNPDPKELSQYHDK